MRKRSNLNTIMLVAAGIFILAGCGGTDLPVEDDPSPASLSSPRSLTQTHTIPSFGFSIDYPEGWFAETDGSISRMVEIQEDLDPPDGPCCPKSNGVVISLDHRSIFQLEEWGLPKDASLDQLFAFNIGEIEGMTNPEITETVVFGVPALRSSYYESQWRITYAGFIKDEAFIFAVGAPTEQLLDDFMPTWDLILASISPIDN